MPTIYDYFGLLFLILTRDEHTPIHVHVKRGGKMSIIEISINESTRAVLGVRRRKISKSASTAKELSDKDLSTALKFVTMKANKFVKIWDELLADKYDGRPIKITNKIV